MRNEDTDNDIEWDIYDNTYSTGRQIMTRVNIEPPETDEDHWEYNEHLCGDGPTAEYRRGAVYHIAEPRNLGREGGLTA